MTMLFPLGKQSRNPVGKAVLLPSSGLEALSSHQGRYWAVVLAEGEGISTGRQRKKGVFHFWPQGEPQQQEL